jgi:hypothetical protein
LFLICVDSICLIRPTTSSPSLGLLLQSGKANNLGELFQLVIC